MNQRLLLALALAPVLSACQVPSEPRSQPDPGAALASASAGVEPDPVATDDTAGALLPDLVGVVPADPE